MKTETTKNDKTKNEAIVKLEGVRLSYPALHVPSSMNNADGTSGKAKFQANFILDKKKHADVIKKIEQLTERVALEKFNKKVTLKHVPLRDGSDFEDKEGYGDDVMFIGAKSDTRPVVVDKDLTPLVKEDAKPYAGCYVNASIQLFAYSHPTGGKGVSASLRVVQFAKDGPAFGAGPVDAEADGFTAVDEADDY